MRTHRNTDSHIPAKLIEKLKAKHKIQTRSFSETSHVVAMIFAQLSHALSLNDICDCLRFHKGYLAQIRDCVPPSRNGLAHANATRDGIIPHRGVRGRTNAHSNIPGNAAINSMISNPKKMKQGVR